jgi:hypothetical protein
VTCEQIKLDKEEKKQCEDKLEKKLEEVYSHIPDCVQELEVPTKEMIQNIAHTLDKYKYEIIELTNNYKKTSRSMGTEREGGYCARR